MGNNWFDSVFLPSIFGRVGTSPAWLTQRQTAVCVRNMEEHTGRHETATGAGKHTFYAYQWNGRAVSMSWSPLNGCGCIRFSLTASEAEKQAAEDRKNREAERAEWIERVKADPVKRAERLRKLEEQKSRILAELETYDSEDPEDREDIEWCRRKLAEVVKRMEEIA